jgi:hypothetical protein
LSNPSTLGVTWLPHSHTLGLAWFAKPKPFVSGMVVVVIIIIIVVIVAIICIISMIIVVVIVIIMIIQVN